MHPIKELLARRGAGENVGIYSVCSANELVLKAAARHAARHGYLLLVEATANQVNQFGGYTGMQPADFVTLVRRVTAGEGLPADRLVLGGDHLGPLVWQALPEEEAMARSAALVRAYTLAGFTKIHLDTSMRLSTDDATKPLDVAVCARRGAVLAKEVAAAYAELKQKDAAAVPPVLVIGSEVPVPGGSKEHEDTLAPTDAAEFERQLAVYRDIFEAAGLSFDDVIAFVVQPGVEFGDDFVFHYDRPAAKRLTDALKQHPPLVFEGHSTDYQTRRGLTQMVEDGIAILKVGPALTFALREGLFLLEAAEAEVAPAAGRHSVRAALLAAMDADDKYWKAYYTGTEAEVAYKKLYSYSDRCRYYLPNAGVQEAVAGLLAAQPEIPEALLSQYFPRQYARCMAGSLGRDAESVLLDRIGDWLDDYAAACSGMANTAQ